MPPADPNVQYVLPSLEPWHRWLLGGLFGAYVLELLLYNAGVPVYQWLPWFAFGEGFEPWQILTRFLVQGASQRAVMNVVFSLVVMFFFLPGISTLVTGRQLAVATAFGALGGTLLPLAVDGATALSSVRFLQEGLGPAMGWGGLVFVLPALLGLARPDATILLLVFPVKARWVLWGTLVLLLLLLLVGRSLETWQGLGVWLGVVSWWQGFGPGARRRKLVSKASSIESQLRNLRVIDGGKGGPGPGPQGRQGRDIIH